METLQNIFKEIELAFTRQNKSLKKSKILFLGICHSCGTKPIHEPLVIEIMKMVSGKVADVSYYDAFVSEIKMDGLMQFIVKGKVKKSFSLTSIMESVPLTTENLGEYDCVVFTTDCTDYDMAFIKEYSRLSVDVREMIKEISDKI